MLGEPAKQKIRREPFTIPAVAATVLFSTAIGVVGGAIASFAVSSTQQSKINNKIANLGKLVGELEMQDRKQCIGQKKQISRV